MMPEKQSLYLIDGSSYIYRAYYAIRHLSSPKGFPTNALYRFADAPEGAEGRKPDHIAVVFDVGRETFRTELYPEYKANRSAMPEDLVPQIGPIKEMVRPSISQLWSCEDMRLTILSAPSPRLQDEGWRSSSSPGTRT
jgi:DNA polymerase-1